jgi:hypothetical protein
MIRKIKSHGSCRRQLLVPKFLQTFQADLTAIAPAVSAHPAIVAGQSNSADGHQTAMVLKKQLTAGIAVKLLAAANVQASVESTQVNRIHL